jgi:predicted nucleotidyltransferase
MSEPNDVFQKRATYTDKRVADFAAKLKERIEQSDRVVGEHTCIYTTGSAGRGELGEHSDLDIFLLSTREQASKLDAMVLQSAIVRALDASHFPPPSNDGEFLTLHTVERLVEHMGGRDDDWSNTFTARMLLLLESRPLVGEASYEQALDGVLAAYIGRTSIGIRTITCRSCWSMTSSVTGESSCSTTSPRTRRARASPRAIVGCIATSFVSAAV